MLKSHSYKTWFALLAVLLVLYFAGWDIYNSNFQRELDLISKESKKQAELNSIILKERLQQRNYELAKSYILSLGENSPEIVEIRLSTKNGFELAKYKREGSVKHDLTEMIDISYSYDGLASLKLRRSIDDVYSSHEQAKYLYLAGFVIIAAVLFLLLYVNVHIQTQRLALISENKRRKQTEILLQDREQNLAITLDSIGDAVIVTDAQGKITRMNPVAEQLTGWVLGEAKGQSVKAVFPIIDATTREDIENPIEKVLATGETVYLSNHTTLISKDGAEYQIADSAAPIRNKDNDILGMVLVFNDVTEQYQLREARSDSEERFRQLAENINEVFWLGSPRWDEIYYISPAYEKIWSQDSEALYIDPRRWIEAVHPDDRQQVIDEIPKDINSIGEYVEFSEYRIQRPDGQIVWVKARAYPIRDVNGNIIRIAGIAEDITERKSAEEVVLETAQRLADAQRMAHIGSWELDLVTNKLEWSDEIYRIFEVDKEKFGASYEAFLNAIHPDDREKVNAAYTESVKNKSPYSINHRLRMADGRIKHVLERCQTFYDGLGNPLRSTGTVQDVTEQAAMEEALRRTQKMDALGKLTGGIAHDFNNMLGVILGYAELLENQLGDQPKVSKYLNEIHQAGERGVKLTAKLLAFSRKKVSDAKLVDINSLLLDKQHMLEKTLTARISLTFELADDLWPVYLDSGDLEDAIVNLSINAMHAIEGNGQLTIQTRNVLLNEADVRQFQMRPGNYVQLCFNDSGSGMDEVIKEHIFEPFFSTKGDKGTGLGLSQVYGFVERSGGAIKVYSESGHGTRMVLYFPRYQQIGSSVDLEDDNAGPDFSGGENILVVDDEPSLLNLTREVLERQGYRVVCAENARQALEVLENEPVDLLLSDVIMPEMDGYQLAAVVQERYPGVKIQLASGFADDRHVGMVDESLHAELLHKPYQANALLKRIRGLLDAR